MCNVLTRVGPDCGSVQPLNCRLTPVHGASLWLRGGGHGTTAGDSEVDGQAVRGARGHPSHVFGTELLSPGGSPSEALIITLLHPPLGATGQQVVVLLLQSGSRLGVLGGDL